MQEFDEARPGLNLDVLDLCRNLLREPGAVALATTPCLRELKVLALECSELPAAGARWLGRAAFVHSLRCLNVNSNHFGPEGLRALLEARPQALHTLLVSANDLGAEGAADLAGSPISDGLVELDLSSNRLGDRGATVLARSKHLRDLLVLRLNFDLSKEAAEALERSPLGKRLAVLEAIPEGEIPF
jgi:hypothetical protein